MPTAAPRPRSTALVQTAAPPPRPTSATPLGNVNASVDKTGPNGGSVDKDYTHNANGSTISTMSP